MRGLSLDNVSWLLDEILTTHEMCSYARRLGDRWIVWTLSPAASEAEEELESMYDSRDIPLVEDFSKRWGVGRDMARPGVVVIRAPLNVPAFFAGSPVVTPFFS